MIFFNKEIKARKLTVKNQNNCIVINLLIISQNSIDDALKKPISHF